MTQASEVVGQVVTQGFGTQSVAGPTAETSSVALAEREKALISAIFLMAERRPRSQATFERDLLAECERPGFADVARYSLPRRKFDKEKGEWVDTAVEGFSIRFAECAMRHWKNVFCQQQIIYEDEFKRLVRFTVIDLESVIPLIGEIQLNKTTERKGKKKGSGNNARWDPPEGREVLGERLNSYGDKIFIVTATEDELQMKQAANWSKFIRNVLRFMPGDIIDAAEEKIQETLDKQPPEEVRKKLVKAFDKLNIGVSELQAFMGHAVGDSTKEDLDELRKVYTAIKEGESSWKDILQEKRPEHTGTGVGSATDKTAIDNLMKAGDVAGARNLAKALNIGWVPYQAEIDRVAAEASGAPKSERKAETGSGNSGPQAQGGVTPPKPSSSGEKSTSAPSAAAAAGQGGVHPGTADQTQHSPSSDAPEKKSNSPEDEQLEFRTHKLKFWQEKYPADFWKIMGSHGFEDVGMAAKSPQYAEFEKAMDEAVVAAKARPKKSGSVLDGAK